MQPARWLRQWGAVVSSGGLPAGCTLTQAAHCTLGTVSESLCGPSCEDDAHQPARGCTLGTVSGFKFRSGPCLASPRLRLRTENNPPCATGAAPESTGRWVHRDPSSGPTHFVHRPSHLNPSCADDDMRTYNWHKEGGSGGGRG